MKCSSIEEESTTKQCTVSNIIFLGAYHCSCISQTKRQSEDDWYISIFKNISMLANIYFYIMAFVAIHSSTDLSQSVLLLKDHSFILMLKMTMIKLL